MCNVQLMAMDLRVAVGMQKDSVLCRIAAPMGPPDDVMVMPSRHAGDFLVADRAETGLLLPQIQQLPSALEVVCHLHA